MARVELDVYCIFTLTHKVTFLHHALMCLVSFFHERITTSTVPAEFYATVSREMKIKNVDTAYDERGQLLEDGNSTFDEKSRSIRDLLNGDSVWVRNSSKDKRTANAQKIHLVVLGPATVGKSGFSLFFFPLSFLFVLAETLQLLFFCCYLSPYISISIRQLYS